jgi:microcystin-dependent protein
MLCDGAQLPIAQHAALYNLIGTTFGGGGTTFALPDLTRVVPKGYSYYIATTGLFPPRP